MAALTGTLAGARLICLHDAPFSPLAQAGDDGTAAGSQAGPRRLRGGAPASSSRPSATSPASGMPAPIIVATTESSSDRRFAVRSVHPGSSEMSIQTLPMRCARRLVATPLSRRIALCTLCAVGAAAARGEPVQATPGGFELRFEAAVPASPREAFRALLQLPRWWSPKHTWSGDAANLRLDPVAGGCWCETWGDGASVEHARVLRVLPDRQLLVRGSLGPLQDLPVVGVLKLETLEQAGRTRLSMSYRVAGPPELALDKWAPVVDQVIGEQFERLKSLVDGGAPR
jgi:uncharacterized protein YndB with AHSA1/START domain